MGRPSRWQDPALFERYAALAKAERLLPQRVTPHYERLVAEEVTALGRCDGPLYRVAYPTEERLALRVPGEVPDFVSDRANMPPGYEDVIIRKYRSRLLFLGTDKCAGHCMYCFRQDVLSDQHGRAGPDHATRVATLVAYLQQHPEVDEVIFSGGDPLSLSATAMGEALEQITAHTQVRAFRVHTRNAAFAPAVFSERLCAILGAFRVRVVLHVVHPYEITSEARTAIARLRAAGARCYSQFPVLRGINDHPRVLRLLLGMLDDLEVRPISLFVPDPIQYSAAFRLSLARLWSIVDELNWTAPAWINSVRLVLDTPIGKVRREDIEAWDRDRGLVTFVREGHRVQYVDFPAELDVPGDVETMLWRRDPPVTT